MLGKALLTDADLILLSHRQINLLFNTLKVGLGTVTLSLALGISLASLIERTNLYARRFLSWFQFVPLLIPPYIYALTWNKIAPQFFLFKGICGTVITLSFSYFPLISVMITAGLRSIDYKLEEAARIIHTEQQAFIKIVLPLLSPYILSAGIVVFILATADYGVPALFQVNVYPVEIFIVFGTMYDYGKAVVMALPLILVAIFLVLVLRCCMGNRAYVTISGTGTNKSRQCRLNKWRIPLTILVSTLLGCIVLIPIIFLLNKAGGWNTYAKAFTRSVDEIMTGVTVSMVSATLSTGCALGIAYSIEKSRIKGKTLIDILSLIPFAVPATVVGIGLILFWNRPFIDAVYSSSLIMVIAYVTVTSPLSVRILIANMKQVGNTLEEAALLSLRGWRHRIKAIWLPLLTPGLKVAWVVSFILSIRELGATLLIIPPGKESLSLKIYSLMHYGANKMVAALSIILLCLTIIPVIIVSYDKNRKSQ